MGSRSALLLIARGTQGEGGGCQQLDRPPMMLVHQVHGEPGLAASAYTSVVRWASWIVIPVLHLGLPGSMAGRAEETASPTWPSYRCHCGGAHKLNSLYPMPFTQPGPKGRLGHGGNCIPSGRGATSSCPYGQRGGCRLMVGADGR